jgi:hypothetical protein
MNAKTSILVIILLLLGTLGGYVIGTRYKLMLQPQDAALPVPQTSTPSPDETAVIIAAVKAELLAEHGTSVNELTISVSKIQGSFAQGGASGSGGGGMWFAVNVNGTWKLVWDGNGTISCARINPYNFPASMIPECWDDATQNSVTR